MGKRQSKPPSSNPIQSYIDYVTDKNLKLWQKDASPSNNVENLKEIHQRVFPKSPPKTKKKFTNFFHLCTYKDQKTTETFDQNDFWRYYLIEKLTIAEKQYDWAELLLKDVMNFKYCQNLSFYLSDIRWFDYQQGIYEINNKKELKNYEIQESLYSRSYCTSVDAKQSLASSKNSQHIKDMLDETNIMNDEFYHIIGENQDNPNIGILQPNITQHTPPKVMIRNSSVQSVFKNNTLVQPNLLENLQRNDEFHANNEGVCDLRTEIMAVQMKKCLFHYKGITEKIERHLSDENNIFGLLKKKFVSCFCKKHHYFYKQEDLKNTSKQIFKELKIFIHLFQDILAIFYKLNDYKNVLNYFLFTKENLLNFVTSLLFESSDLSDLILTINQELNKDDESQLQNQYENAKEFLPADFEVSNKYCLNEKTLQYIYEKKNLYAGGFSMNNSNFEKSNYTSTAVPDKTPRANSISKTISESKQIRSRILEFEEETQTLKIKIKNNKPFQKAIRKLRKITSVASPLHKLKTILQTSEHLFQEIRDFYGEFDFQLNEGLGGDELLGLFVFIVAQAKIPDLLSHCAIIKTFLTSNLTNSISGYYLVTIQVAMDYLLSMKIDKKSRTFSSMKEFHQFMKIGYEKTI